MADLSPVAVAAMSDTDRGSRCGCGHYRTEHSQTVEELDKYGACRGAYATLMADADDFESVEVNCTCGGFYERDPEFPFIVR